MNKIFFAALILLSFCPLLYAEDFPYQLNGYTDGGLCAFGAAGMLSYIWGRNSVAPYTEGDLPPQSASRINCIDRSAAGRWSVRAAEVSNFTVGASALLPLAFAADVRVRDRWYVLYFMYAQSWLLCSGITETLKVTVHRTRPFVYGSSAPESAKLSPDARKSFPSGHTSSAFNAAVFTSLVFSDLYPSSAWTPAVWAGALSAASLTGYLRYRAGKHFPSDIAAGALIGAGSAASVVLLHRQWRGLSFDYGDQNGIAYTVKF